MLDAQVEGRQRHQPGGADHGQGDRRHCPLVQQDQHSRPGGREDARHGQHGVQREALQDLGQDEGGAHRTGADGGEEETIADRAEAQDARPEQGQ